jgi:hypothetical protein
MKRIVKEKRNRTFLYGAISSLIGNWLLFLHDKKLPFVTSVDLLFVIVLPLLAIAILIKSILRGNIEFQKWDIEQAKEVFLKETGIFRRSLAVIYIIIDRPILFLGGWAIGTGILYAIISKRTLFLITFVFGSFIYYIIKKAFRNKGV